MSLINASLALALAVGLTTPAVAQVTLAPSAQAASAVSPPPAAASQSDVRGVQTLPAETLAGIDGRGPVSVQGPVSDQQLLASDTGNAVIAQGSISSGALSISSGALNNFNGVGNFVLNTGANNTLQGSISITISMPPK